MWRWGKGTGALALALAACVPALALAGSRVAEALGGLEHGRWLVRSASQAALQRTVCLGDPKLLFQLEHGAAECRQEIVQADPTSATVEYVCPGRGFGHTSVRVETSKAATIETQGFIDGRPFSYRATARRLSDC